MKYLFVGTLAILALGPLSGCASDPCAELEDVCQRCTEPSTRDSCTATITLNGGEFCEGMLDHYSEQCP